MGTRGKSSDESTTTELVEEVQDRGRNIIARLLLGLLGLVINAVRALLAGILYTVGGLVGGVGGTLAKVTGALRAVLKGTARFLKPGASKTHAASGDTDVADSGG